ncbi:MAG TPA: DsrE family protein [Candidatus Limnocylindria bacterium]|nr:DsrE family protein [Candidatus Limnocylindria bacterium]
MSLGARPASGYLWGIVSLAGKKLGVLLSGKPEAAPFTHGVKFATAALAAGCDVYLYCIDDAVPGVTRPDLQALRGRGLKLYACAYGAHRREIPVDDSAAFAGLTVVSDLIAGTERFVSFN